MTEQVLKNIRAHSAALAILAGLLLLVWLLALYPIVRSFSDLHEAREAALELASKYKANIARRGEYEAELARIEQSRHTTSGLIEGDVTAIAAAKMQNDLRTIIEKNDGEIRTTQNLEPTKADPFERIDLSYTLSLPMGKLTDVLYQIETHTPYFFIDKIDIRMPENWQPSDERSIAPKLEVKWVVSGYRWAGT